jgi:uncharacterized protein (TIGR02145 family)
MKKLFILLLIIPILGFSQNDLVFNRVLNFKLNANETVTVPTAKAWKIEGASETQIIISNESPAYGSAVDNQNHFASTGTHNAIWLGAGSILHSKNGGTQPMSFSILEFNVVAASSSSGGSTGSSNEAGSTGTFVDNDGNSQEFVNTGSGSSANQWSTSNASHTTYRDGTPIPQITNAIDWDAATTGAWCYYMFDESNASYGKLYNFFAVVGHHDQDDNTEPKLFAPEGWRVPAVEEWIALFTSFGGGSISGGADAYAIGYSYTGIGVASKLKSTTSWNSGYNGTNLSGFNAKAYGGYGYGLTTQGTDNNFGTMYDGNISNAYGEGLNTKFWSNSRRDSWVAYGFQFNFQSNKVFTESMYTHDLLTNNSTQNGAAYVRLVVE